MPGWPTTSCRQLILDVVQVEVCELWGEAFPRPIMCGGTCAPWMSHRVVVLRRNVAFLENGAMNGFKYFCCSPLPSSGFRAIGRSLATRGLWEEDVPGEQDGGVDDGVVDVGVRR